MAKFAHVGSCWPQVGASPQVSPRSCQGVQEGSASKALVFQDVHAGSPSRVPTFTRSFGLFHPLALHLKGCFFLVLLSACPVNDSWQLCQNDVFKSSSQGVLVGSSFWKFHLFSCIARRHSGKYMVKYIQQKQQQRHQHKNLLWQFIQLSIYQLVDA